MKNTQKESELLKTIRKWENLCDEGRADATYWKDQSMELKAALKEAKNQLSTVLFEAHRYGFGNERINQMSAATLIADRAIAKTEGQA